MRNVDRIRKRIFLESEWFKRTAFGRVPLRELFDQPPRRLQIRGREAFRETIVNRSKWCAGLARAALLHPQPSEAQRNSELPKQGAAFPGQLGRLAEAIFCL